MHRWIIIVSESIFRIFPRRAGQGTWLRCWCLGRAGGMTFLMLWRANTWGGEKRTEKETNIKNALGTSSLCTCLLVIANRMESVWYLNDPKMTWRQVFCLIFGLFGLTHTNHMEVCGTQMTPKWSICFIFGLFDCFRLSSSNSLCVGSYIYLHHLQSYVQSNLGEAWTRWMS